MSSRTASVPNAKADAEGLPTHVGIIMDGNGRWAQSRGKIRSAGHLEGLKTAKAIVQHASKRAIPYISLYVFSTENWKRTVDEVGFLMNLVDSHILAELPFYQKNNIRLRFSGNLERLPPAVAAKLLNARKKTAENTGTCVNLAINYGGRDEIIRAIKRATVELHDDHNNLNEETLRQYFDNPDIPDLDLVIRTAGEQRTSNFFIWQAAYAELYMDNKLWPDWTVEDFDEALAQYTTRTRRYGGV